MPTLKAVLSGICLFVPNRPFDDPAAPPDAVTVLAPDLSNGGVDPNGMELPPHYFTLRFRHTDMGAAQAGGAPMMSTPTDPKTGFDRRVMISAADVRFVPDGQAAPGATALHCVNGQVVDPQRVSTGEERYLHWLPMLSQLGTNPVPAVDRNLLAPTPPANRLIGRVFLDSGSLESNILLREGATYLPTPPQPTVPLTIPLNLLYSIEFQHQIAIVLTPFGGGAPDQVVLTSNQDISVLIENMEADPRFDPDLQQAPPNLNTAIDIDFSAHYWLCVTPPKSQPRPVAPPGTGGVGRLCTPAGGT